MSDAVVPQRTEPNAQGPRLGTSWLKRALDSDMFYSFRRSKMTMVAAAVTALFFLLAIFARSFRCRTRSTRRNCN